MQEVVFTVWHYGYLVLLTIVLGLYKGIQIKELCFFACLVILLLLKDILNNTMWQFWKLDPSIPPKAFLLLLFIVIVGDMCLFSDFFWTNSVRFVFFVMCGH